jgi:hypothetical protein
MKSIPLSPAHLATPYRAHVGHDPGPCIAVVSRVILCLGAREGERLLNADYVHLFCKDKVESCDVAGCAFACLCPADLEVSVSELFVAAVATVLCLAS